MDIRLTSLAACAGCAAKLGPADLARVVSPLNGLFTASDYPDLLVGLDRPDDAAVYRISADVAVISTVDFFPPVVDSPYDFGAVAAANALSDVYAMGGDPLFAVNLVAYPDTLGLDVLSEILRGGAEKVREAGAVVVGGHTVTDQEPKYGLAVTGSVHPDRILHKGGARPGDLLILSKALGTGTITTALKHGIASEAHARAVVSSMKRLNRAASHAARAYRTHAMTDVTGFSLMGHSHEMAHLSDADLVIAFSSLCWIDGAREYADRDIFPGGMGRNRSYFEQWVSFDAPIAEPERKLLFDPQTSGGLLVAVHPDDAQSLLDELLAAGENASLIGEVRAGRGRLLIVP
ncbi:MAG: selenide, water dikinase SelD [Anaerolineae bacterium]